jgi:hypothetical protein
VLDAGTMIAGPLAATHLADFGAEVTKIEQRRDAALGADEGGRSLWWKVTAPNKRLVTLTLSHPEGQPLFRRMVADADIVIENCRPGTFERWAWAMPSWRRSTRAWPWCVFPGSATAARARWRRHSAEFRDSPAFRSSVTTVISVTETDRR